eukprot:3208872-Rhodomonas_salina.1
MELQGQRHIHYHPDRVFGQLAHTCIAGILVHNLRTIRPWAVNHAGIPEDHIFVFDGGLGGPPDGVYTLHNSENAS